MNLYDHIRTENYWQKKWEEDFTYRTDAHSSKPTFFGLVEFPYPSGAGLHVGHVRSYTGMDVIVRKRRMEGFETLFPIGWDAFGLPAENYAIKTGIHPSITTRENINTFREQLKACGFSFDWDREVDTTDPAYYKWTQWIFLKLYENNLAYKKEMPVNWCPKDKCVLANEEVVDGKCERCGAPAEKRNKEQWMLAITKYAERLDKDLDDTTFLERIKIQQRNWIGMSEGSEINFKITSQKKPKYVIFDFDGVIGDTYDSLILSKMKLFSEDRDYTEKQTREYFSRKPNHIRGAAQEDIDSASNFTELFGKEMATKEFGLFEKFVEEITSNTNLQYAIVSAGSKQYILPALEKSKLSPTHILCYEDHHSKEEKIENIVKDWNVDLSEISYVTDTLSDVYELGDFIGIKNIFGCAWGYQGKDELKTELPESQILDDFLDFNKKIINKESSKKKVLVIHGFDGSSQGTWKPWIKTELEKDGYEVVIPDLPNAGHPKFEELMAFLSDITKSFTDEDIVIGHSMGGYLALKLAEQKTFKKVLLVAPCVGDVSLYDYDGWQKEYPKDDYASLKKMIEENPVDYSLITTKARIALFSENDPSIPFTVKNTLPKDWVIKTVDSEGHFPDKEHTSIIEALDDSFTVYTTRADTLFGCTYCVLAPEHTLVKQLLANGQIKNKDEVEKYIAEAIQKIDIDRSAEGKEKTGVLLEGVTAINPANKKEVPVFIADYVLATYGTGAIMAVPAHDERDGEFAKKYNLDMVDVIAKRIEYGDKEGVESTFRNIVDVIIKDKEDNFYLIKDSQDTYLIGGGIEEGETEYEALTREVMEESGFTDFVINKNKRISPQILCSGYHLLKNKNKKSVGPAYEIVLNSDKRIPCEVEEGRHELIKVKKEDVLNTITWKHHKYLFEQYLKGVEFYTEDGVLINSGEFDGLKSEEARIKITEAVGGKLVKKSKLRDWVFARQRYWGEPIPLVYDKSGKMYPVAMSELPVTLPQVEKYEPTDNGESPLSQVKEWVYVKGKIDENGYFHTDEGGEEFRRETDTMPQWAGSSWYFMRYIDPRNDTALGEKEMLMKWLPVTWYNGGMEHTTLHLLYSRFWYKFLFDIGLTPTSEPYIKRTSQGMLLGIGGVKMSKSLGNVINPDVIVKKFGADTLRMYEMFIGPFDQAVAWDDKSVIGIRRFIDRLYTLRTKVSPLDNSLSVIHKTIKKVGEDIDNMAFNTAISSLMICLNEFEKETAIPLNDFKSFLKLLAPFAPFITEELWKELGETSSIHKEAWPKFDETKLIVNDVTYVLQVNGKLRGEVTLPKDANKEEVLNAVKLLDGYVKYVGDITPKQQIFIPGKLVNVVI